MLNAILTDMENMLFPAIMIWGCSQCRSSCIGLMNGLSNAVHSVFWMETLYTPAKRGRETSHNALCNAALNKLS